MTKRAITVTADSGQHKTYGDPDPTPFTYQVTSGELVGGDSFTGALARDPGEDAGTYAITQGTIAIDDGSSGDNYNLTYVGADFTIEKAALSVNAEAASKTYGDPDPAFTYNLTGFKNAEDATSAGVTGDPSMTRAAGETVAGSPYTITAAPGTLAADNYDFATGTTAQFYISAKSITGTFTAQSKTYDGTTVATITGATLEGVTGDDDVTIDYSSATANFASKNVGGSVTVHGTGFTLAGADADSYSLDLVFNSAADILAKDITVTADSGQHKTYGDPDPTPFTYQVTSGELVGGDSFNGALARDPGEDAGTYAITQGTLAINDGSGGDNYNLTYVGADFTIDPAGTIAPTITSLDPTGGTTAGGTSVTITGAHFTGVTTVTFGVDPATSFTFISDTQITAVAPAHAAGTVRVQVTTPGGSSIDSAESHYTYSTPLTLTRYEQTDHGLYYHGIWMTHLTSPASGGNFSYTDILGSYVTVRFNGTYLAWIAKTSRTHGYARVTLDDRPSVIVDLYSSATLFKQKVWETPVGLSNGDHTLKIECTHTGRPGAVDTNINVDAFDVIGTLSGSEGLTRYQQTSALMYAGAWSNFRIPRASFGSYWRSSAPGASVTIPFKGTRLDWIATKGTTLSKADVYVDGAFVTTVDLANPVVLYQQNVFTTGTLADGYHTVKIVRNAHDATGKFISLDAVDVLGTLASPVRFEQTDPHLLWTGNWTTGTSKSYSGGNFAYTNRSGSSVTVNFSGVMLTLIAKKSPPYGKVRITLDHGTPMLVNLYSSSTLYKQKVWSSGFLAPGDHTVRIEWTGLKSSSASAANINVDAFNVIGTLN